MTDGSLYQLRDVTRRYKGSDALSCPSLFIKKGGVTGIAGPNGSGKSTLLKLLAFIDRPTSGEVLFHGKPEVPFSEAIRHRVTLLPQIPFLLNRSVFDNVAYGLEVKGEAANLKRKVHRSLERVGLSPSQFASRRHHELSGGEAQRVALAARLVLDPDVLILDEPTASVDAASTHLIRQAILSFAENPEKSVILTSHDAAWLSDVSDEVHFLFRGRPVKEAMGALFFGPFEEGGDGRWVRCGDDSGVFLPEPPKMDAVAALPEKNMGLNDGAGDVAVFAEVREVTRRAGISGARVVLMAGGQPMTLTCAAKEAPEPGTTVHVTYDLSAVTWL